MHLNIQNIRSGVPSGPASIVARFARHHGEAVDDPVHWRGDHPVVGPFTTFDDAVRAAQDTVASDRDGASYGLFGRHHRLVIGAGVRSHDDGTYSVGRVSLPVDPFQTDYAGPTLTYDLAVAAVREPGAHVDALVGATRLFDLRGGSPAPPTRLP